MADLRRLPGAIAEHWDWQLGAQCRGMDVGHFYHPPDERNAAPGQRIAEAKKVCHHCPVIAECLDHALRVREPYGIWGGHSETSEQRYSACNLCVIRLGRRRPPAPGAGTGGNPPSHPGHAVIGIAGQLAHPSRNYRDRPDAGDPLTTSDGTAARSSAIRPSTTDRCFSDEGP